MIAINNLQDEKTMTKSNKIDILRKIGDLCQKEYNDESIWSDWVFDNLMWSDWKIINGLELYLKANAKILYKKNTLGHLEIFCGYPDQKSRKLVVIARGRLFDLKSDRLRKIVEVESSSLKRNGKINVETDIFVSDILSEEVDFFVLKAKEITETISNFINTVIDDDQTEK